MLVPDDDLDGADEAGGDPGMLQDRADHEGRRRLALGAGDADDLQFFRRIMEISGRNQGQGIPGILHQDHGRPLRHLHRMLGYDDDGAVLSYLPCDVVAVEGCTLDADEHALLLYFFCIVYQFTDIDVNAAA